MDLLFIIFLIIMVFGISSYYQVVTYSSRTSHDISTINPYATVVGKTLETKQVCYLAKNIRGNIRFNPYLLRMVQPGFAMGVKNIFTLPVGTPLRIIEAREFTHHSGYPARYVLGTVYIAEINRTLAFELQWELRSISELESMGTDRSNPELMPWQETPLSIKYFETGVNDETDFSARPTDPVLAATFRNLTYQIDIRGTQKQVIHHDFNNTFLGKKNFSRKADVFNFYRKRLLNNTALEWLKGETIYPTYAVQRDQILISQQLDISLNFITLIFIRFTLEESIETTLVNYDLTGQVIDQLTLCYTEKTGLVPQKQAILAGRNIRVTKTMNQQFQDIDYTVDYNGKIILSKYPY